MYYLSFFLRDLTSALRSLSPITTAAFLAFQHLYMLNVRLNGIMFIGLKYLIEKYLINKEYLILYFLFCWHSLIPYLNLLL